MEKSMIWLLKWRQTVWIILLVSLVWSSGVISVPPDGQEQLAGWWLMEEQSGYGHGQRKWVKRQVSVPLWLAKWYAWVVVGGWTGVSLGVGWQIWTTGGTVWSSGLLTVASHQVRTGLNRVAEVRHREAAELSWQTMMERFDEVAEGQVGETSVTGMVSLARQGAEVGLDKEAESPALVEPEQSPAKAMGQSLTTRHENLVQAKFC